MGEFMATNNNSSRFLSLPAELRERIYNFCFHDRPEWSMLRPKHNEPPLLLVCQIIREEALPIFYSKLTLLLKSYIKRDHDGVAHISTKTRHHCIPAQSFRHIVSFRLRYGLVQRRTKEAVSTEYLITLRKRENDFDVALVHYHNTDYMMRRIMQLASFGMTRPVDCHAIEAALRQHLEGVLRELVVDPGVGKFGASELDGLLDIDPDKIDLGSA